MRMTEDGSRPLPVAFEPRPKEEYLSVDWLEHLADNRPDQLQRLRPLLLQRFSGGVGAKARLVVLKVGITRAKVTDVDLEFIHEPNEADPSPAHSGIHGVPSAEDVLMLSVAAAIAETFQEVHVAR